MALPPNSQVGNVLAAPAINLVPAFGAGWQANFTKDDELLYSTNGGFTQKGVTLAPGQGILPLGTLLARSTVDKLWYAYQTGGANGLGAPHGVLRQSVDTGAAGTTRRLLGNIVIAGILKNDKVSGADAAAVTALGARVDTVMGTFRF